MAKQSSTAESRTHENGNRQPANFSFRHSRYSGTILGVYCIFALAVAAFQIFFLKTADQMPVNPVVLIVILVLYSLAKTQHPVRWYFSGKISLSLTVIDIAVCVILVVSTGGLESPFLLYTLSPVLRSALFLNQVITAMVVLASGIYVVCAHLFSPFSPRPDGFSWSYFIVYLTAACLSASLPYLVNFNLRQRLRGEDILAERQRLSREIHDGSVQNLTALRWHAELLNRRLSQMGIDIDEARQLLALTEKSREEALTTLELLRCNSTDTDVVSHIRDSLKVLSPDITADFQVESGKINLEPPVEHELLRICQEAITNIKKHSRARHARIKMKTVNSHLEITIADDGEGFDAVSCYHDGFRTKGHGLAVMKERADLIGGKFRVLSFPGKGTEIQVEVPTASRLEGIWRRK